MNKFKLSKTDGTKEEVEAMIFATNGIWLDFLKPGAQANTTDIVLRIREADVDRVDLISS